MENWGMMHCSFLGFVKVGLSLLWFTPSYGLLFFGDNDNLASTGLVKRESPIANNDLSWAGMSDLKNWKFTQTPIPPWVDCPIFWQGFGVKLCRSMEREEKTFKASWIADWPSLVSLWKQDIQKRSIHWRYPKNPSPSATEVPGIFSQVYIAWSSCRRPKHHHLLWTSPWWAGFRGLVF